MSKEQVFIRSGAERCSISNAELLQSSVNSGIGLIESDIRRLEYQLSHARKKEKALEEALYVETLEKISYRKKSETSLMFMSISFMLALSSVAFYTFACSGLF